MSCAPRNLLALFFAVLVTAAAQTPQNVLVVINDATGYSRTIGEYYAQRRGVPQKNICRIKTPPQQDISRFTYSNEIAAPIASCLKERDLVQTVLYIVTNLGVPLRILGSGGLGGDASSVDSELTMLYWDITHGSHEVAASLPNPSFGQKDAKFSHPQFAMYLVTRIAAYDVAGMKAIIDRSMMAANKGNFVIDLRSPGDGEGDNWLRDAAVNLPPDRVVLDQSTKVL